MILILKPFVNYLYFPIIVICLTYPYEIGIDIQIFNRGAPQKSLSHSENGEETQIFGKEAVEYHRFCLEVIINMLYTDVLWECGIGRDYFRGRCCNS